MRAGIAVITALLFLLLQAMLAGKIAIGAIQPDFPLLFVVYISLHRGSFQGTIIGFVIGLVQDLFNPSLLGLNALLKSILGFVAGHIGSKMERDSGLLLAVIFALSQLGHDLLYLVFYYGFDVGHILRLFVTVTIPSSVYTALIGFIVHTACSVLGLKVVRVLGKAQ